MKKIGLLIVMVIFSLSGFAQDNTKESQIQFKPTIKINGRVQYDYEFLKRADLDNGINDNEFRRIHFSVSGNVAKNLKYKVETDFSHGDLGFRDVYIKYTAGKYGNFAIGSVAEPTSLEMMTSSKYISFFERAMLTSMQNFRWGSGLHYENYTLLDGKATFQMALTNNGHAATGFVDTHLEDGMNFVARATGTLLNDKEAHKVVHLGVNYANRPYNDFKFRAENHMGADQNTGKYHYVMAGDRRTDLGLELGTTFGSLSVQGEYKTQSWDATGVDYNMASYYAFASYFLTGEHRPYKHAAFGRVKPKKDIDNGGFGAVELLARYSAMHASDDVANSISNVGLPQDINNITLGLNWYLNSHARIMYNYVLTDDNSPLGNLSQHLFRVQIDF